MDPVAAKQFLISRVIEEANLETVSLSEVEKKMLQFTEAHPTIPDIYDVNDEFERNYDCDKYETRVALLLKNARARDELDNPNRKQEWEDALTALRKEDHYISVMVNQAFREGTNSSYILGVRARDLLIYTVIGVVIVLMIIFWPANH